MRHRRLAQHRQVHLSHVLTIAGISAENIAFGAASTCSHLVALQTSYPPRQQCLRATALLGHHEQADRRNSHGASHHNIEVSDRGATV